MELEDSTARDEHVVFWITVSIGCMLMICVIILTSMRYLRKKRRRTLKASMTPSEWLIYKISESWYHNGKECKTLKKYLENDGNPDHIENGKPLLYVAMTARNLDAMRLLLQHGANPNIQDLSGATCFFLLFNKYLKGAYYDGFHDDAIELLLEYNADMDVQPPLIKNPIVQQAFHTQSRHVVWAITQNIQQK